LLSSDILTAAGFKPKGLQPLRDDMLQQMQLQISQYWLQVPSDAFSMCVNEAACRHLQTAAQAWRLQLWASILWEVSSRSG
jgi:hypothetical protein